MSYQPPLIGSRDILNFTAHSWPASGGVIAILAAMTAVLVSASELRRGREGARAGATAATLLLAVALSGCDEPGPRPLVAGVDVCTGCLMVVDGGGHGAEVVTRTGKVHTFDSAECMANHLLTAADGEQVHSAWVTDFSNPTELVPAETAFYLVSETLTSPMGLGITAFSRAQDREGAMHAFGGDPTDWSGIQALVAEKWPDGRPSMKHGGHSTTLTPPDSGQGR